MKLLRYRLSTLLAKWQKFEAAIGRCHSSCLRGKPPLQNCATWTRFQSGAEDDKVCVLSFSEANLLTTNSSTNSSPISHWRAGSQWAVSNTGIPVVLLRMAMARSTMRGTFNYGDAKRSVIASPSSSRRADDSAWTMNQRRDFWSLPLGSILVSCSSKSRANVCFANCFKVYRVFSCTSIIPFTVSMVVHNTDLYLVEGITYSNIALKQARTYRISIKFKFK